MKLSPQRLRSKYFFSVGPPVVPILGNSPLIKKYAKKYGGQHKAFLKLSEEYKSNVLGLRLGSQNVIVVHSYELVRHVLTTDVFEGRPDNFFLRLRCMGRRRGVTCTDGETWSTLRNFLTRHLRNFGFGKSPMESKIQEELSDIVTLIQEMKDGAQVGRLLAPSVLSVLWSLVAGTRILRTDPQLLLLLDLFNRRSKVFDMSGGALSHFPFLRFIVPEKSGYNLIKRVNNELYSFFMKTIKSHYETWSEDKEDDVIHAFISEINKNSNSNIFTGKK